MDPQPASVRDQPASPPRQTIARSAGVAGAATLTSRVLGLVRDTVLAASFGAGNQMDAFNVAFRIPNLVRDLFAEGAMSAAFVPTFTRHLTLQGKTEAWRLGNNVFNAVLLITGALVILGMVFTGPLVTLYAGDYAAVPGKLELTIFLTRVMLPFLTLAALAAVLMGMLNSLRHYFLPALAPATFNVAAILGAVLIAPLMPAFFGLPPIVAIAGAALLGGWGQMALQWPTLATEGYRYRPVLDLKDPGLRRMLVLLGPGTVGLAATQLNLLVNTVLATSQGTGAVSWLTFAFRLMYLPIGLFGVSIGTAVLPAAARHAALDDPDAVRRTVSHGLGLMLVLNLPATLGLMALSTPIVQLIYERGQFQASDTAATAAALQLYAIGLVGYSVARIASPVFYALGDSRTPVLISIGSVAANVVVSLALVGTLGFRGLALATAVAALTHGAVLLLVLRRRLGGIEGRALASTFAKISGAALVMTAVALAIHGLAVQVVPGRSALMQAVQLTTAILSGMVALAIAAKALKIREFDEVFATVRGRVQKLLGSTPGI